MPECVANNRHWQVLYVFPQLSAYGGNIVYTVSYNTDQQEQVIIRVTSEPDLIIEVSFQSHTEIETTWSFGLVGSSLISMKSC